MLHQIPLYRTSCQNKNPLQTCINQHLSITAGVVYQCILQSLTVLSSVTPLGWSYRGGVPVCFPQFGDMGPVKAQHGFARNTEFTVVEATGDSVTLSLSPDKDQRQGDFPDHTLSVKVLKAHTIAHTRAPMSCLTPSLLLYMPVQQVRSSSIVSEVTNWYCSCEVAACMPNALVCHSCSVNQQVL